MDQPKKGKKNAGFSRLVEKYVAPELAQNDFLMKKIEKGSYLFYKDTNSAERILLMEDGKNCISCILRRNPGPGVHFFFLAIPFLVLILGTDEEKEAFRFANQSIYYTTEEELLGALEFCVDIIQRYSTDFFTGAYDEILFTDMKNYESWREKQVAEMGKQAFMNQRMEEGDLWREKRFYSKRWSL